jgi:hypothetical protein
MKEVKKKMKQGLIDPDKVGVVSDLCAARGCVALDGL